MFVPYVKVNKFSKEANFRFHIIKNKKKSQIIEQILSKILQTTLESHKEQSQNFTL